MKCPNCGIEMKDLSYWYYGIADWDMDYPDTLHEEYECKKCKIKKINGDWKIPKQYVRPTEKQVKCIEMINKNLGTHFEPLLKNQCIKIIRENLQKSINSRNNYIKQKEADFECWCEDNADWLPEYY